ncbi:MAG TPA: dienelactone hydrolase family protein [Ramlibacter sp.]|nr:dienelactone hydrolase family protein [Ramlibacter sp.]
MQSHEWVSVPRPTGHMDMHVVQPDQPARAAVVVLQEAFGVNAHIQDICGRMAGAGYLAVAPDLFHRTGPRELRYDQRDQAMSLIAALGPDEVVDDVRAALQWLQQAHGFAPGAAALIGFCFGGRAAFTAATAIPDLGAAVVFYGPGIAAGPHAVLERAAAIRTPLLLHVGADDPTIPQQQVQSIAATLRRVGAGYEQHVYAAAGHAFACDARPAMYRPGSAALAWQRTFEFLEVHLRP